MEFESQNKDHLDQWIDNALASYSDVEPRLGIENRVLVHLQAQQAAAASRRRRWIFAFACVALMAVGLAIGWLQHESNKKKEVIAAHHPEQVRPIEIPVVPKHEINSAPNVVGAPRFNHARTVKRSNSSNDEPKLAEFPSQRPLSEQERLLKVYVSQFPEQARLVAREQTQRIEELKQLYENEDSKKLEQER